VNSPPPLTWRLAIHPALPSTADLVAEAAAAGEAEGLAVLALRQTAGRGRAGRGWVSPPGNLYLSVLLRPATPPREAGQWSLLAGVALAEAASALLEAPTRLTLKWPNDLLLDGAKCAGILAESTLAPDGKLDWLTLGIGVNLAHAPELPDRPTAHLNAAEGPEGFAQRLLARLAHWRTLALTQGFAPVRTAWQAMATPLGSGLRVRQGSDFVEGLYAGLAEDGSLLLHTEKTTRRIIAGEVEGMR
jgi:BirA family biotin operon repressor/biotin-[acetyl-CoA-carboxylase] ligase